MPVILLIDDNKMLSLVEARYIQRAIADVDIVVSSNARGTLELAGARHPDVTIMDTDLLDIDAVELHHLLCNIVSPASILVTADSPSPKFEALKASGMIYDIVVRPFPISAITSRVEQILTNQGIQIVPYKSSIPPASSSSIGFDRHLALNQLSGLLGAVRAFEAEIEGEGNTPPHIRNLLDEYIPRIVELVQDVAKNIKRSKINENDA